MSSTSSRTSDTTPKRRKPPVSAEHTLSRVRENQRKHRARRRDYIATLEAKLAETERQLADARAEIDVLRAGQSAASVNDASLNLAIDENWRSNGEEEQDPLHEKAVILNPASRAFPHSNLEPPEQLHVQTLQEPFTGAMNISSFSMDIPADFSSPIPACCSDPFQLALPDPDGPECPTCATRPPPSPSESTTLCTQAYLLIQQQNFRGVDAWTIRMWLVQGFRRAQKKGEGCSVENSKLMSLLDFISGM